jgi:hypothetical protein
MVFAEQTGRGVETVDLILREAIETLQSLRANRAVDGRAFDALLQKRINGVRQIMEVAVTDPAGRILYSSRSGPQRELPVAFRALIQAQGTRRDAGLVFSKPLRDPHGKWTSLMFRRIADRNGSFAGAALAYLISGLLRKFL